MMKEYEDKRLQSQRVFEAVGRENARQLQKWGVQKHNLFVWGNFAAEEMGELHKAIAEHHFRNGEAEEIYKEAIQTATLCLKIAEMVKSDERIFNKKQDR